jgi:hypothetical protein
MRLQTKKKKISKDSKKTWTKTGRAGTLPANNEKKDEMGG